MATKCQKFQPNIFNKLKCQSCFASKELHSSEALENNKASRKVTKCGYLFVSPDFDFNNPLDRGKRWQRRFFRLYDDGELTFSVDEDPETIPQGVADLNKCTDVKDAEKLTTHPNSLAIITPNKTHYIKADSKEEIMWWHDILAVFPRANIKPKNRRFTMPIFSTRDRDKENVQPIEPERKLSSVSSMDSETTTTGRFEVEKLKGKEASFNTFRGVRNMKHRTDKHYQDGLRKSSSLHDLSSEKDDISMGNLASSRFLSRSGDRLNYVSGLENTARILSDASIANNPYCTVTRNTWQSLASNSSAISLPSSSASSSASPPSPQQQQPPPLSAASSHQPIIRRRGSLDEKVAAASTGSLSVAISSMKPKTASERARMHRDRSTSMKDFPTQFVIPKQETNTRKSGIDHLSSSTPSANRQGTRNVYEVRNNETDEHKMAKSSELQAAGRTRSTPSIVSTSLSTPTSPSNKYDDLMYMKKGWLIKQGSTDKDWKKHWFVLSGNSLRYYKDAKAEESNNLDGRIDLTNCYDISEVNIGRNFGFRIKSRNGEYVLSAMTSGIRNNWLKAIRLVMDLQSSSKDQTDSEAPRTVDDLDLSSSLDTNRLSGSYDSRSGSESPKELRSRETTKNVRRHYSDVSPANVGKLFSLRDIPLGPARVPAATTTVCVVGAPDPDKNRDKNIPKSLDSPDEFGNNASLNSPTSDNASQLDSMNRFVEGSDNSDLQSNAAPESGTSFTRKSESRKEEEEKTRRAKSPSARVRERTKAKASKLVASSVDSDEETAFRMAKSSPRGDNYEAELGSGSSQENLDDYKSSGNVNYDDSNFDSLEGSNSDGVLLELLKTKLDTTTKELVKTQEDNIDLKSKLQTVTREKDLAQVNNMRRQLKEARETISKQKTEIESLRSKLDMSSSKLAGTERALSEALKDLKQEKDKFMKLSNDWNKKIRNLESQLKDANHKIDRQKDSFSIKESECKRLEEEVRSNHKKIRENERELLKLKSIENDYKQMKEKIDEMDKKMIALRSDVREKEHKCKDIESQYERHIRELENEFAQERDDMEQHMEDMKKQYMEAQRQNVQSDMSDLLHEKMEIIARLEEQGIEFEKKIREMSEELQNEVDNNVDLQNTVKKLHAEREKVDKKLKELERVKIQTTSEKQKLEEDNKSLLHHLESYEKDLADLSTQLEDEKDTTAKLGEENEHLQSTISDLHSTIESLEALGMGSNMDDGKLAELLNNFSVVETEMGDVSQTVHDLRKAFENYLKSQRSSSQSNLVGIAQLIDCISTKCEHLQDILKDGLCELDISESKLKQSDSNSEEITILREKYEKALKEANQLKKEVGNSFENCKQLESKNKDLQDNMKKLENNYQEKINTVSTRVDELASVVQDVNKRKSSTPSKPKKENLDVAASWAVSEEIEQQLNELEERITYVDNILKTPDMSAATEDEEEETDEDDEDDSDFLTSEEEDDSEEESEDETENNLLSKLQEMKTQLQTTTSKIRDITADINHQTFTISDDSEQSPGDALKTAMLKYGEKIDSMTSKLNEKMKAVKSGGTVFEGNSLENTLAFHHFVKQMQWKLVELNSLVAEQETLDAKSLGIVHGKVMNLLEYLNNLQRFKHKDYDLLGKITRQNISAQAILNERESRVKRSRLHFEEKVHMYANRLTVEAIILGQMAYLVQRFNMSELYRDVLILEIQGANSVILDLERKIDESTKTISSGEDGVDLVSSYAAILAEKIVLEGRLASCAMAADNQTTDDSAILAGFQITDNPSILAMEVFLRCQLDSSIHKKLQDSSDNMDTVTGHIVTRSLVQGELTHAIQHVKKHFIPPDDQKDVDSLVGKERLFLYEQLKQRCECASTAVDVYLELVVTCLRYNVDQSNSPNLLKSLSAKFSEVFSEKTHYLEDKFASSKGHEKSKYQHLLSAMDEGMSVGLNCLKELGESRTPPSSDNTEVLNITSAEKTLLQLSEILIQRATIKGTVSYISEMMSSGLFPVLPDEDLSASPGNNQLSNTLSVEAEHKQALAAELKTFKGDTASSEDTTRVMELLATIPECGIFNPDIIGSYGETLLREAMHQTQLTYMTYKTKLQYERQMREMKMKIEAGQKVDLPADSNKDAEGDIHASLSIFEEILETKFEDECEVLSILDKEIKELQLAAESGKPYDQHLMNLIQTFDHEMSVAQERHDIHVDVLRQEVNNICLRLEKMMEEHEKDKECMISHYEERIATLQDELDCQKVDHEEELAQVRQDILTAVSAIKANEEHNEVSAAEGGAKEGARSTGLQVENLQKVQDSLSKFSDLLKTSTPPKNVTDQLLKELKLLEAYISEQAEGEIGPMSPLNLSPSKLQTCLSSGDKQSTRQSVNEDGEILDRSQHDYELEMLKKEKDDALAEEMRNTKAALDAMRKAYDEELQEEKEKYREALKTMYTDDFLEEIRRRHSEDMKKLQEELKSVNMHYESKCEDYKLMEDKMLNQKSEFESHIQSLQKSNGHLNELLNEEIEKLKNFVKNKNMARIPGNATLEEELYDAQIMARMKDAELQKLRAQVSNLENSLERSKEEHRNSMTQYLQVLKKYTDLESRCKKEAEKKEEERASNRSLRRTPSFHHRARSPSPQPSPPGSKKDDHHSRDSHRRRHIEPKDLKRSKSSPSLPYVFGGRIPAGSSLGKSLSMKATKSGKSTK